MANQKVLKVINVKAGKNSEKKTRKERSQKVIQGKGGV